MGDYYIVENWAEEEVAKLTGFATESYQEFKNYLNGAKATIEIVFDQNNGPKYCKIVYSDHRGAQITIDTWAQRIYYAYKYEILNKIPENVMECIDKYMHYKLLNYLEFGSKMLPEVKV
jgi:hypothetical protein